MTDKTKRCLLADGAASTSSLVTLDGEFAADGSLSTSYTKSLT